MEPDAKNYNDQTISDQSEHSASPSDEPALRGSHSQPPTPGSPQKPFLSELPTADEHPRRKSSLLGAAVDPKPRGSPSLGPPIPRTPSRPLKSPRGSKKRESLSDAHEIETRRGLGVVPAGDGASGIPAHTEDEEEEEGFSEGSSEKERPFSLHFFQGLPWEGVTFTGRGRLWGVRRMRERRGGGSRGGGGGGKGGEKVLSGQCYDGGWSEGEWGRGGAGEGRGGRGRGRGRSRGPSLQPRGCRNNQVCAILLINRMQLMLLIPLIECN